MMVRSELEALLAGHLASTALVTVVCRVPGIRRNGIRHPASETYPLDRWTVDELLAFDADPAFELRFDAPAVAAGADTADAVQDNGAGPPIPDLGAKPDGSGPAAPVRRADGTVTPGLFDASRIEAIRGRFVDLGLLALADAGTLAAVDFTTVTEEEWVQVESLVGFRPTINEMREAVRLQLLPSAAPATPAAPPAPETAETAEAFIQRAREAKAGFPADTDWTKSASVRRLEKQLERKLSTEEIAAILAP